MNTLVIKPAKTFHGNNTQGYITAWQNTEQTYESVQSWPIYRTKTQAQDILRLIAILAYVQSLDFAYTLQNTKYQFYSERGRFYALLYTEYQTLMEYYDQDVIGLIDDGFINPRNAHKSMLDYYNYLNS